MGVRLGMSERIAVFFREITRYESYLVAVLPRKLAESIRVTESFCSKLTLGNFTDQPAN